MSSILTNTSAMTALQTLRGINQDLGRTQDMISTGKRVATARDNAAVFAISKVMESDVAGFNAISESLSLGASTIAVASNATNQVGGLLEEIKNKITSANGENVDRATLQNEITQLRDQITGIVGAAQFNGLNLLQGDRETSILASLDRSSTGAVTSKSIAVSGRDYGNAAGTAGSDLSKKNMALGGDTVTGNTLAISIADATDAMTSGATDEELVVEIDGVQLTIQNDDLVSEGIITAGSDASDADVANYVARAINNELSDASKNFNVQGLTATVDTATADATVTLTSTASEAISVQFTNDLSGTLGMTESLNGATATAVANAATSTERSLDQVTGTVNTPSTLSIDFNDGTTDSFANAADDEFTLSIGDESFTYTATGTDTDSDTSVANIVAAFNQELDTRGITSYRFAQADGEATGSLLQVNNFDTTNSFDVTFDAADFANPTVASQDRPTVDAATAEPLELTFGGNIVEGDSFTVSIGSTTSTYVAGRNETAADVARGLQNVLAADGPSGIAAGVSFDGSTNSATLTLTGDVGFQVSISEASGGTESTGDLYGLSTIDVTTAEGAEKAIGTIENLIQINVDAQADFGATARRVDLQNDFMSTLIDSFKSGIGALVDTDMEAASARLQALQVQQQLAVQSLSIANQAPQTILSLFR